jgi:hypothetical protein
MTRYCASLRRYHNKRNKKRGMGQARLYMLQGG